MAKLPKVLKPTKILVGYHFVVYCLDYWYPTIIKTIHFHALHVNHTSWSNTKTTTCIWHSDLYYCRINNHTLVITWCNKINLNTVSEGILSKEGSSHIPDFSFNSANIESLPILEVKVFYWIGDKMTSKTKLHHKCECYMHV